MNAFTAEAETQWKPEWTRAYVQTYHHLSVAALTSERHQRTCGYWYTVTDYSTPHTAFGCMRGLHKWACERGLTLPSLPEKRGEHGYGAINGAYRTAIHGSYDVFYGLKAIIETKTLNNGKYTLARVTEDPDGLRTVHILNVNNRHRPEYDHETSRFEMGDGYIYE